MVDRSYEGHRMNTLLHTSACTIYRTPDELVIEVYTPDAIRAIHGFKFPKRMKATVSVCCDPALEFVRTLSERVQIVQLLFAVPVSLIELAQIAEIVTCIENLCIAEQVLTATDGDALSRFQYLRHLELWDVTCEEGVRTLAHILPRLCLDVLVMDGMNAPRHEIAAVCREANVRVAVVDGDEALSDER